MVLFQAALIDGPSTLYKYFMNPDRPPPIPRMPRITQLSRFNTMGVRLSTCTIRIAPTAVSRSRFRKSERAAQVKGKWGGRGLVSAVFIIVRSLPPE